MHLGELLPSRNRGGELHSSTSGPRPEPLPRGLDSTPRVSKMGDRCDISTLIPALGATGIGACRRVPSFPPRATPTRISALARRRNHVGTPLLPRDRADKGPPSLPSSPHPS